jgi:hypothetical protein
MDLFEFVQIFFLLYVLYILFKARNLFHKLSYFCGIRNNTPHAAKNKSH